MRDELLSPEELSAATRLWWLVALTGVLSIAAGAIVLAKPDHSLRALAVITGVFILIDGIVELVRSFDRSELNRGATALLGALNVIIGVLLIRHPLTSVQAIALFIGLWLLAAGVVRLVMAFGLRGERLGQMIVAGIEILAGVVIVSSAHIGYATLAILVGASFIANGIGMVAFGILLRTMKPRSPQTELAMS
jgi:uncharacterized membrane protein HdeD (DUF308 family)